MTARRGSLAGATLVALALWASPARAYEFDEHEAVGYEAYREACARLGWTAGALDTFERRTRFRAVCGRPEEVEASARLVRTRRLRADVRYQAAVRVLGAEQRLGSPDAASLAENARAIVSAERAGRSAQTWLAARGLAPDGAWPLQDAALALAALAVLGDRADAITNEVRRLHALERTARWAERAHWYGQAAALAGDHVSSPDELMGPAGEAAAASLSEYSLLARVNYEHFHPYVLRKFRQHHAEALAIALAAARASEPVSETALRRALLENAFADHYLHDAFSSGHMAFNRVASSVTASAAFHDIWNVRGRWVVNRRGDTWRALGDGLLRTPEAQEHRARLLDAATSSVLDVLHAFVLGELRVCSPSAEDELPSAVWTQREGHVVAPVSLGDGPRWSLSSLEAVFLRAHTAVQLGAYYAAEVHLGPDCLAHGGGAILDTDYVGLETLRSDALARLRAHLLVGGTSRCGRSSFEAGVGGSLQLGYTGAGVLDHRLTATLLLPNVGGAFGYKLSLNLERAVLSIWPQYVAGAGLGRDGHEVATIVSLEYALGSKGGGIMGSLAPGE